MNKLVVFLRSDLESMTPGKAAAQVAHAASQCAFRLHDSMDGSNACYPTWENDALTEYKEGSRFPKESHEGFWTTIVLDGGSGDTLEQDFYSLLKEPGLPHGMVVDPSYPVRDGQITHFLEMLTCTWIFGDSDANPEFAKLLKRYKLYNGNNVKKVR